MSSPPSASPIVAPLSAPHHITRGLHFEGTVLGFNLSTLVHSSSGSVTLKIRFETPQFSSEATGITWSKRSTLLSASVSAVAPSDFGRRVRCNMRFSGDYSLCDDGLVIISVCKRRHRRSNWKTIASTSLALPALIAAPFSGDLTLKKHDIDAATVTVAVAASIVDREEQPGLLSRMHGKVKSSIARIFQGSERSGPADPSAPSSGRVSTEDGGSGYSSEVQGYFSDGQAAATLRRRGSKSGMAHADDSSEDELDDDDARIQGIANFARKQEGKVADDSTADAGLLPLQHDAAPSSATKLDDLSSPFADVSLQSDEGLEEVTADGCLVDSCDGAGFLSWLMSQGSGKVSSSWGSSMVDTLGDHSMQSAATLPAVSVRVHPWVITRTALASSSSGLWVKACVMQLCSLAQSASPMDLSALELLLQQWSGDTAPRNLLLIGSDALFSSALRFIAQSPIQTKITVHLIPLKHSTVADRIGSVCSRYQDTFLQPTWIAALSKFDSGSCNEEGVKLGSVNCNKEGHYLVSKIVSLLLDGVHSTQLQVATAVIGAEGGDSKQAPIFHQAEVTCGGDIKLDYWTAAGKKTKLRNVKYPVSLRLAAAASGNVSLVVSVSLGGSKRSVFDRFMTSKKTLASIDRGVAVTKVLVRSSSLSDQLTVMTDGARVSDATLFANVTLGSDWGIACRVACFKPDCDDDLDSAGSLSSAASWEDDA